MGRIIRILVAAILISTTYTVAASEGRSWWTNWWGDQKQQQRERIQKRVVAQCEKDMAYWRKLLAEHPDNSAYKQYYYEAKKRCDQDKEQWK
jgi:hypothetical protein